MLKKLVLLLSIYVSLTNGMTISCSEVSPCYVFQTSPIKYVEPLTSVNIENPENSVIIQPEIVDELNNL